MNEKTFSFITGIEGFEDYFIERKKVNAVLLFIDITSFSKKFSTKPADEIAKYLDKYYEYVISVITKNDGVIEKIIGDGIICVFGLPFLNLNEKDLHRKAENCSMELIRKLKGTEYEVKIALCYGEIMYYNNKNADYWEYTMIGNALTDLFRLESISINNSINFYCDTIYERLIYSDIKASTTGISTNKWDMSDKFDIELLGVKHKQFRYILKT